MTSHSHEVLLRELFRALDAYDLATLQILLAPDVVFHVPGQHLGAGDFAGCDGVAALWAKQMWLSAGSFVMEIQEVLEGTSYAAVLGFNTAEREGRRLEDRTLYLLRFDKGRVAEGWLHPSDQRTTDAFWA